MACNGLLRRYAKARSMMFVADVQNLMDVTAYFISLLLDRGSAKEVEYFLKVATEVAEIVRSEGMQKRPRRSAPSWKRGCDCSTNRSNG